MKKYYALTLGLLLTTYAAQAQFFFDVEVDTVWYPDSVIMPPSPLKHQILFIGQTDTVQTTATYGNPAGEALAKQWHDFIGFTPDTDSDDLGWISVNHEMISDDDNIGDGGGMTVFKVKRDPATDTLIIVDQTLSDGRHGKYFNVDFVNTVGETGMNCGGINSPVDGRIWTAEEWYRGANNSIAFTDAEGRPVGVRDTSDFTITTDIPGEFAGKTIEKFQNFNWMVEIDPREAVAIRKQYNWGRQAFEGGVIMHDNQTVYTGEDGTPGLFSKFVADTPGDFTKGTLYVYKHDAEGEDGPWIKMDSKSLDEMLFIGDSAFSRGATMFNRIEWVAQYDGKIYFSETGRDDLSRGLAEGSAMGGVLDYHWLEPVRMRYPKLEAKTDDQVLDFVRAGFFEDYYGRVNVYDPATGEVDVYLEGGPFYEESPEVGAYPDKHLSNPDGLNVMEVNGQPYMVICEDLNGTSNARVPAGITNRTCEAWMLDMSIAHPTVDDLIRISVVPVGAEVTGAQPTPDGKTLLLNAQHPSEDNPFPYNNSLTYAITGWDDVIAAISDVKKNVTEVEGLKFWADHVQRVVKTSEPVDMAIYDVTGQRIRVSRNVQEVDVQDLRSGVYIMKAFGLKSRKVVGAKFVLQ